MNIKFNNGISFEYINAYSVEYDYHKGKTRPSLEIHFPVSVISYNELEEIVSDASNLKEIVLTGNTELLETGESYTPQNTYNSYNIKGKITVDDERITVKLYKKSDLELENEALINVVDELLIAMEV